MKGIVHTVVIDTDYMSVLTKVPGRLLGDVSIMTVSQLTEMCYAGNLTGEPN